MSELLLGQLRLDDPVAVALAIARIDPGRAVRCDQLRAGCPSARRVQRLRRAERTVSVWFAIGC